MVAADADLREAHRRLQDRPRGARWEVVRLAHEAGAASIGVDRRERDPALGQYTIDLVRVNDRWLIASLATR